MLKTGILNPQINSLLSRVRHTNMLVIQANFVIGEVIMACEFREHNTPAIQDVFATAFGRLTTTFEPHIALKQRVPGAIGLIRTGDPIAYANMILVSA